MDYRWSRFLKKPKFVFAFLLSCVVIFLFDFMEIVNLDNESTRVRDLVISVGVIFFCLFLSNFGKSFFKYIVTKISEKKQRKVITDNFDCLSEEAKVIVKDALNSDIKVVEVSESSSAINELCKNGFLIFISHFDTSLFLYKFEDFVWEVLKKRRDMS